MDNTFRNKKILVTGGTGSIGSEIVVQLLKYNPEAIRIFSRDETKQVSMRFNASGPSNNTLVDDVILHTIITVKSEIKDCLLFYKKSS